MWELKYSVIRSNRKTIWITIDRDNSVLIKAPKEATDKYVENFFNSKKLWVYTKLEEKKYINLYKWKKEIVNWEWIYYLWRLYKLKIENNMNWKVAFHSGKISINENYINIWRQILKEWYKCKFYEKVIPRIQHLSKKHWIKYKKVFIRDLKYRWGSCSPQNNLTFTWKIVMAPVSVIDYIICHELAHIKEKNHSKKYWNVVGNMVPDYERHIDWLKRYGVELYI